MTFLTLLQSPYGSTIPGGGNVSVKTKRFRKNERPGDGWGRERAILEASVSRFKDEASKELQNIYEVMSTSQNKQAQRIARKIADYSGEIDQVQKLQIELLKLEIQQEINLGIKGDLLQASEDLKEFLRDEEDIVYALIALQEYESKQLFAIFGINLH